MRKVIVLLTAGLLAGCDLPGLDLPVIPKAPTAYHTVDYYDVHTVERAQTKAWCDNNPASYTDGMAVKYPSCKSASASDTHASDHRMGWK